ncbi:MAG: glycogen debranching protein, partial [Elusimicrobia bacterium]|nr:glycogen debranching protein [Elusimicrobiota bacterium]
AAGALHDVVEGDPHGSALRPNMVFAVGLEEDLLFPERQAGVLRAVTKDLLTPFGLRTLSLRDSRYRGRYHTERPPMEKDLAYHQGSVWPWLMGGYIDALARARRREGKKEEDVKNEIREVLAPLLESLMTSPEGSLPEVFDGDPPHRPGGTRSQAWSVAEV